MFRSKKSTILFKFLRFLFHLPNFVKLAIRLFLDRRVPIFRKAILVVSETIAVILAAIYFVFPLDFDFLPIVGKIDDLLIALFLISAPGVWLFVKMCPEAIVREHVNQISTER